MSKRKHYAETTAVEQTTRKVTSRWWTDRQRGSGHWNCGPAGVPVFASPVGYGAERGVVVIGSEALNDSYGKGCIYHVYLPTSSVWCRPRQHMRHFSPSPEPFQPPTVSCRSPGFVPHLRHPTLLFSLAFSSFSSPSLPSLPALDNQTKSNRDLGGCRLDPEDATSAGTRGTGHGDGSRTLGPGC